MDFLHYEMGIDIDESDIDRSHRLGPKKAGSTETCRPIAVQFVNFRLKEYIYSNRKFLKGYYINESLSKGRSSLFFKARELKRHKMISDTWTRDGNIFIKTLEGAVKMCTRESHLPVSFAVPPNDSENSNKPSSTQTRNKTTEPGHPLQN